MKKDSRITAPDLRKLDNYVRLKESGAREIFKTQVFPAIDPPKKPGMWNTVTSRCLNWTHIKAADRLRVSILPFLTLFYANQIYDIYNQKSPVKGDYDDQSLFRRGSYYGAEHIGKNAKRGNLYLMKAEQ